MYVMEIKDIEFSYSNEPVLKNINININNKDFHAILGPNGGGKSTLLLLILNILKPHSGSITIFNRPNKDCLHRIGYVPQKINNNTFPIRAIDVIKMGLKSSVSYKESSIILEKVITKLDCSEFVNKNISDLSGGQRQRIFIGRALASSPDILLLDEPTASIDSEGQSRIYSILKELNKEITIIMVTHDLNVILKYAKTVSVINKTSCYHKSPHIDLKNNLYNSIYTCPVTTLETIFKKEI